MNYAHDTSYPRADWQPWQPEQPLSRALLQIWLVPLDHCAIDDDLLNTEEQQRLARLATVPLRQAYAASRCILRRLLGHFSGQPPQALRFARTSQGKPLLIEFPRLHFNLSHSGSLALIAISAEAEVGVDLEPVRMRPNLAAIARRVLPEDEVQTLTQAQGAQQQALCFTRSWVRFEARQKMTGAGLFGAKHWPPHQLHEFDIGPNWLGACALASSRLEAPRFWRYLPNRHAH